MLLLIFHIYQAVMIKPVCIKYTENVSIIVLL